MAPQPRDERGAAVADFAMVSILVLVVFLATFQLGLVLHVRNTLISCASEGARLAARADAAPGQGVARSRALIGSALSPAFAQSVSEGRTTVDGIAVVEVEVTAPLPVVGFLGPAGDLRVVGRAFAEDQ